MEQLDAYLTLNSNDCSIVPNLKGYFVGNGVTYIKYDLAPAMFNLVYWDGIYSEDIFNVIIENCDLENLYFQKQNKTCNKALTKLSKLMGSLNIYDLFGTCWKKGGKTLKSSQEEDFYSDLKMYTYKELTPFLYLAYLDEESDINEDEIGEKIKLEKQSSVPCAFYFPVEKYLS